MLCSVKDPGILDNAALAGSSVVVIICRLYQNITAVMQMEDW